MLTRKVTLAPYRGAGRPETTFVINRVMDRIADAPDLDPVEVRRRNLITPEEMPYAPGIPYRDGTPMVLDSGDYPATLDRCLEAISDDSLQAEKTAARDTGRYVGIGAACNVEATGLGPFEGARVAIDQTGHVFAYTGVADTGQGHETVLAQVCADGLGITPDQVTVVTGDTATVGFSHGTYHSRAAVTAGNAVHAATIRVRQKLLEFAAGILEADAVDLELADGSVHPRGARERSVSFARCAQISAPGGPLPAGMEPGLDETAYVKLLWTLGALVPGESARAKLMNVTMWLKPFLTRYPARSGKAKMSHAQPGRVRSVDR